MQAIDFADADYVHVDVMDGPMVVKALRPHGANVFDVHLTISPADRDSFTQAAPSAMLAPCMEPRSRR